MNLSEKCKYRFCAYIPAWQREVDGNHVDLLGNIIQDYLYAILGENWFKYYAVGARKFSGLLKRGKPNTYRAYVDIVVDDNLKMTLLVESWPKCNYVEVSVFNTQK